MPVPLLPQEKGWPAADTLTPAREQLPSEVGNPVPGTALRRLEGLGAQAPPALALWGRPLVAKRRAIQFVAT